MPQKATLSADSVCVIFEARLAANFPNRSFARSSESALAQITLDLSKANDRAVSGQILVQGQPDGPSRGISVMDDSVSPEIIGAFLGQLIALMPR